MDGLSGFKIEKLRDSNFHVWKQRVELLLAFRELDGVITKSAPSDEVELREWNKKDAKAKAVIGLTLNDDHLDHVRGVSSAREMWEAIMNIFQRRTVLNKLKARRQFYSAQMEDNERILNYINRVRQLAADLKSMEVAVSDEDIAMSVLSGLPQKFEHLIVAIDTVTAGEARLSLEFVKSRLLQEEQRLNDRSGSAKGTDTALVTDRKSARKCTYCKKKNHTEPFCWKKQKDEKAKVLIEKCHDYAEEKSDDNDNSNDSCDYVCLLSSQQKTANASSKT